MSGKPSYVLQPDGTFVIEDYNQAKPFASFFPGIAGLTGVPLWAFYVNRGQAIASFGVKNKDNAIMEFFPANNAYAVTPIMGFRTFLKISTAQKTIFYEPFFSPDAGASGITQTMRITAHDMSLEEINPGLGLKIRVRYFTLPREPLAALVRVLEIENTGKLAKSIEVVDGLPKVIPCWVSEENLKHMSYTAQAWATVTNVSQKVPFYRLKVEISDRPEVTTVTKGNFYFAIGDAFGMQPTRTDVIVDPEIIFGQDKSFVSPRVFKEADNFMVPAQQQGDNIYPSAMSWSRVILQSGKKYTLSSVAGHGDSEASVNAFAVRATKPRYFEMKALENQKSIDDVTHPITTHSNIPAFDQYCKQTYLDNLLRGGTPIILPAGDEDMVFYVYSRKHGDLERDYNNFQLSPTYYSQGNGNYRDMNQNKRNDIFFVPRIKDYNVIAFYNLIQLDGYNPLLVKGSSFCMKKKGMTLKKLLARLVHKEDCAALEQFFSKQFEPGSLMLFIDTHPVHLKVSSEKFLNDILACSERCIEAEHGEGFWTDHWTYNLDLLESYTSIYPEHEHSIIFTCRDFTFYDNAHVVLPRAEKHVLSDHHVRQFGSVVLNAAKAKMVRARSEHRHLMHTKHGSGTVYHTTLAAKMICIIVNKIASLDPDGIGIEMEAEKPSWYDALNGLPGVFGSSVPETFELKRLVEFLRHRLEPANAQKMKIMVPEEVYEFFRVLGTLLTVPSMPAIVFWEKAATQKEAYRSSTMMGISGLEKPIGGKDLSVFLEAALAKINAGIIKALDQSTGLYYTYFSYTAKKFKKTGAVSHQGCDCVRIESFQRRALPLFLEAEVHYLKTEPDKEKARALYQSLLKSPLFDAALNMYKVNASLSTEPTDIGRCTVFTPGWLENESIWLHMEYKYLLELLKAGLHREFFDSFHKAGVCFQKPESYGRSILENSSFIASSAFFNHSQHGRGFVARLSGSTAEFIEMWVIMTCGNKPFSVSQKGELVLAFKPVLPGNYFTKEGTLTATFLGTTKLRYHNLRRLDTFAPGMKVSRMTVVWNDGKKESIDGPVITGSSAQRIRRQEANAIDVFLAFQ
jgi:hypothetical protein